MLGDKPIEENTRRDYLWRVRGHLLTRSARGLPPLARTTPHSLRRTYISIALLANRFDVKSVMSQVGHADSKMTLDVYAQLEQRFKREHGVRFDAVVRDAGVQLHGARMRPEEATGRLARIVHEAAAAPGTGAALLSA